MATIFLEIGYLETDYLAGPYYEGTAFTQMLFQVDRRIDSTKTLKSQVDRQIVEPKALGFEVNRELTKTKELGFELDRALQGEGKILNFEVDRQVSSSKAKGFESKRGGLLQGVCGHTGYLLSSYLSEPYLTAFVCVRLPFQVNRQPQVTKPTLFESLRKLNKSKDLGFEVERRIDAEKALGFQADNKKSKSLKFQLRKVLYNTFNIRILQDFPSRGLTGSSWSLSIGSQAAGDFGINNLNTDIVEQTFRTTAPNLAVLVCDTGISNGVFVDTIGILNHNLTTSADVKVEGSQSTSFTNSVTYNLRVNDTKNIVWVNPDLPLQSYRYWRFTISNPTNVAGYIEIGSIVFGSALIFQGENIVDSVTKTTKHYADKVETEGFTSVSNDRALKTAVSLEFRNLDYLKENYALLQKVFLQNRTSLKALWIPTPRQPERFAVFGKLATLPSEQHQTWGSDVQLVSFSVEVDESL